MSTVTFLRHPRSKPAYTTTHLYCLRASTVPDKQVRLNIFNLNLKFVTAVISGLVSPTSPNELMSAYRTIIKIACKVNCSKQICSTYREKSYPCSYVFSRVAIFDPCVLPMEFFTSICITVCSSRVIGFRRQRSFCCARGPPRLASRGRAKTISGAHEKPPPRRKQGQG